LPITFDQKETACLIHLEGEVNITSASELKKVLLLAIASGRDLLVNLERAKELDVTALQLLWAAEREASGSGLKFTVATQMPDEIFVAIRGLSFEKFPLPLDPK
jgi:anti-anti-sigma factor